MGRKGDMEGVSKRIEGSGWVESVPARERKREERKRD